MDLFKRITSELLAEYRDRLIQVARLSPRSINRKLSSLRAFCQWAKEKGYLAENPFGEIVGRETLPIDETGIVTVAPKRYRIPNLPKHFFAPISVKHFPTPKKILHHLRYTRPKWYKTYHLWPITHYFHWAILIIFCAALGFGIYQQFFARPPERPALALPTVPPRLLSFQGRLTDASDNPITTQKSFTFKIFDTETVGTGNQLWSETKNITPDQDGIFNTLLGDTTGIPDSVFRDYSAIWLEVIVVAETLSPRQRIATVAYALNAEYLQGFPASTSAIASTVPVVNSSGNLVIAAASPTIQSTAGIFKLQGQSINLQSDTGLGGIIITPNASLEIQSASPAAALRVNQQTSGDILTASASGATKFAVDNSGNLKSVAGIDWRPLTDSTTALNIANASGTDFVTFDTSNSRVGIGTTNPDTNLHVFGGSAGTVSAPANTQLTIENSGRASISLLSPNTNDVLFSFGDPEDSQVGWLLYDHPTNKMVLGVNDANRVTIDDNGDVGIGTDPDAGTRLHIKTTSGNNYLKIENTDATGQVALDMTGGTSGARWIMYIPGSSTDLRFYDGAADRITFQDGGNVGINTTGPDSPLDVLSTGGTQLRLTYTDGTVYTTFNTDASGNLTIDSTGTKQIMGDDLQINGNDILDSGTTTRLTLGATITASGHFTVSNSGQAAVGTAVAIFNQYENQDILTASASGTPKFTLDNSGNLKSVAGIDWRPLTDSTTALNIANASGTDFVTFDTTNSRVGIGTTGPGYRLEVTGSDTSNPIVKITNSVTSGSPSILQLADNSAVRFQFPRDSGGGALIEFPSSGIAGLKNTSGGSVELQTTTNGPVYLLPAGTGDIYAGTDSDSMFYLSTGTDVGFYKSATSEMTMLGNLTTSGNITTTGSVGIGNTSPLTALDVTGSASVSANLSLRGAGTAHTFNILDNGTLNIQRSPGGDTGTSSVLYLANSGYVGIGTTGPGAKLHSLSTTEQLRLAYDVNNLASFTVDSTGKLTIQPTTCAGPCTYADLLLATSGGNVGIGTTGPGAKLHVLSDKPSTAKIDWNETTYASEDVLSSIEFGSPTGENASGAQTISAYIRSVFTRSGCTTCGYEDAGLTFGTMNTSGAVAERLRITQAGNVGIGTTNPGSALEVNGEITQNTFTQVGADPMCWDGTAPSKIGDCTSLEKYKNNIQNLNLGLGDLLKLTPREFDWVPEMGGQHDLGFVAEEVETVSPLLVTYREGALTGVKYGRVSALLTKAIQEQQLQIASLRETIEKVKSFTETTAANLRPRVIETQEIITQSLTVATDSVTIGGQTFRDYIIAVVKDSGIPPKARLASGGRNQESVVISPLAEIDQISTNVISPLASDSVIIHLGGGRMATSEVTPLSGGSSDGGKLIIENASGSAVATIDSQGNASFAGEITGKLKARPTEGQGLALEVEGNASIAGELRARKIIAEEIEGPSTSSGSANYITTITNIYEAPQPDSSRYQFSTESANLASSENQSATHSAEPLSPESSLQIPDSGLLTSDNLTPGPNAEIASLSSSLALFKDGLSALGTSSFYQLGVAGMFSQGTSFIIDNGSEIEVLSGDLYLQKLAMGGLNILDGKLVIDKNGNLTAEGDVAIKGTLSAGIISPLPERDLVIRLGASQGDTSDGDPQGLLRGGGIGEPGNLVVQNASGSAILTLNQGGDLQASGSGTFSKLKFNLIGEALALSETEVIATGSAGSAVLQAQQEELTIKNHLVGEKSLIYLTPTSGTENLVLYLRRQVPGVSFTVGVAHPPEKDLPFNWLILN